MRGLHLTADLYQCRCDTQWLADARQLGAWCRQAVEAFGLQVQQAITAPDGSGATASVLLLLPASHVSIHADPHTRSAAVDVFLAGTGEQPAARARELVDALVGHLQPAWTEQRTLDRGDGQ